MDEKETYKILEITKKKIAISQFEKEAVEEMREKKESKTVILKKVVIGTTAGIILTIGSVGAYASITGNTEPLKKLGINIEKQYKAQKQNISGEITGKGFTANLVSAACDSSCIVLEIDIDLEENENNYKDIDLKIENLTLTGDNIMGSTNEELKLSENSISKIMENGKIKLFKYISIKDPNLEGDGFLNEISENSNKVNCKIEFSELYDINSKQNISEGKWNLEFALEKKEKSKFVPMNKKINIQDITVNVEGISRSSLGNYIILTATQDKIDINQENDIQKLEYIIRDSNGREVKIVSKTYNISGESDNNSKISIETTLKLDDISENLNYNIDVRIGKSINIKASEISDVIEFIKKQQIEDKKEEKKQDEKESLTMIKQEKIKEITTKNENSSELFLTSPLDRDLIITTKFGTDKHNGVDLKANGDENIYSINKGEVIDVGFNMKRGKYIIVKYKDNTQVVYGTCSKILKNVGDKIDTGDIIAKTGSTGFSTGPHLHFEILINGVQKDLEDYMK